MSPKPGPLQPRPALVLALVAALLLSLLAAWGPAPEPPAEAVLTNRVASKAPGGNQSEPAIESVLAAPPTLLRAETADWTIATRRQLAAWEPPAPAPVSAAPPPQPAEAPVVKPAAPAVPYRFIGRLEEGARTRALLDGPARSLAAQVGDVLDAQWRVERIDGAVLHLRWLPDASSHTLRLAAAPTQ